MMRTFSFLASALLLVPISASAKTFAEVVSGDIVPFGDAVIMLFYALAFFLFLFGVLKYFFAQGEEGRAKGKQHILWGIIALAVLFAIWGIIRFLLTVLTSWA
jgi:hypothetical protein